MVAEMAAMRVTFGSAGLPAEPPLVWPRRAPRVLLGFEVLCRWCRLLWLRG
jgi:hypothetical protein